MASEISEITNEPVVPSIAPKPPFALRERGYIFWAELYPEFSKQEKLNRADHYLLARYCTSLAEWESLDEWSRTNEPFKEMTSSKNVKYFAKHPKISRLEFLETYLPRLEKALCIGAGSRAPDGSDDDDGAEHLFHRRKKK
jgi:phage terminase small subunit